MNIEHLTDSDLMDLIGLYDEEPSTWHAMLRQVAEKEMERRREKITAYSADTAFRLRHARRG